MAWTKYQFFLAVLLVFTGSINSLATKWADMQSAEGRPGGTTKDGHNTTDPHPFDHPFLQSTGMFFGEFTCLLAFKLLWFIHKQRNTPENELPSTLQGGQAFNPLIFLAPAMCDMVGTSIMYIGLNLTYVSSFQMLRGSVIIFTGILSVIFLKRRLRIYQWIGMVTLLLGLIIVGMSDMLAKKDPDATPMPYAMLGNVLIVAAQVIAACQMVLEEKFVSGHNVSPMQAVGWEGLFGMSVLGVCLIPMSFIYIGANHAQVEDSVDAVYQIGNNWQIAVGFLGTILSISFFNFAGVSVTKEMNATTRMVLDSVRTIFIWLFSLALAWQAFQYLQLIGFFFLMVGMCLYNNVLILPFMVSRGWIRSQDEDEEDEQAIVNERRDDEA